MKAKLIYFDIKDLYDKQKLNFLKNNKEYNIKSGLAILFGFITLIFLAVFLFVFVLFESFIGNGDINEHIPSKLLLMEDFIVENIMWIMLILGCISMISLFYFCSLAFNRPTYYITLDGFMKVRYNLEFIKLLSTDNIKFLRIELHREKTGEYLLEYVYDRNGKVIENKGDMTIKIEKRTDIDELWFDVKNDYLYVPYEVSNKIASLGVISVDTSFNTNNKW